MRAAFTYLRPRSPQEAVEFKSRYGDRARFWAGGTDMVLLWEAGAVALDYCIDLTFLKDFGQIDRDSHGLRIGSLVTLDALVSASDRSPTLRALGETARLMCTPQTRTIATIGGNLCHASPSADLPPLLIAMDARVQLLGTSGERTLSVEDFLLGVNQTAIADDEMLTVIEIPVPTESRESSYRRIARTVVDIALVSSSVSITASDVGVIDAARVVLGSVGTTPIRARAAELALVGQNLEGLDKSLLDEVGRLAAADSRPISDIRAGEAYRKQMCNVLTRRAIEDCVQWLGVGSE
jgi:carbon-monoxide dehydrogenase medium subunit